MPQLLEAIQDYLRMGGEPHVYAWHLPAEKAPEQAVAVMEVPERRNAADPPGRHIQVQVRRSHPAQGMRDAAQLLDILLAMPDLSHAWCCVSPYLLKHDSRGLCVFTFEICTRGLQHAVDTWVGEVLCTFAAGNAQYVMQATKCVFEVGAQLSNGGLDATYRRIHTADDMPFTAWLTPAVPVASIHMPVRCTQIFM